MLFLYTGITFASEPKLVHAVRTDHVRIDGILDEDTWQHEGTNAFIQSDPTDGGSPSEKTSVWIAYDEKAIYIGARLYDSQPDRIIGLLGRRDEMVDSDWFMVALDPYFSRHSGYQFGVNPRGSIMDMTLFNDSRQDLTWDGIWESAARINNEGWTVEIKIPFHQLRFKKKKEYIWGINFQRIIKRKNESVIYAWRPREETGFVSRFAQLVGIKDIRSGTHLEVLPYSVGKLALNSSEKGINLRSKEDLSANAGMDIKYNLRSNLIFDFSINPDFGQVEVDPAVINLTEAETYYPEKRPFFVEGSNLLNFGRGGASYISAFWQVPTFFYSRRVGHSMQGQNGSGNIVDYPEWNTILTAAKIVGKLGEGWNIGFLNALTERELVTEGLNKVEVEPFSSYSVFRLQKEFNQGRQGIGFILGSVLRKINSEHLENEMVKNAISFGIDGWSFLNSERSWILTGWLGTSRISGDKEAISMRQHSFIHYFQRPDVKYIEFDENATSLSGWAGRLYLAKQGGNFIFNASLGAVSPGFDVSDIGFQNVRDLVNGHIQAGYTSLHPGKIFRRWHLVGGIAKEYDFGGNKTDDLLFINTGGQVKNYWAWSLEFFFRFDRWTHDLTRGGPLTLDPAQNSLVFNLSSDNRKPFVFNFSGNYTRRKLDGQSNSIYAGIKWKIRSNFKLSIGPFYSSVSSISQWITAISDPHQEPTFRTHYIYGDIDQRTLSCSIQLNWIFSPKLSLQAYIQPLIGIGLFDRFKELAYPNSFDFTVFTPENADISSNAGVYSIDPDQNGPAQHFSFFNPDFNYKSLRGTVVLRWEFRPGSRLFAVWTQKRLNHAYPGDFNLERDFSALLSAPGDNIFMIKMSYYFDI